MKYCSFCGAPMEDADRYCSRCGKADLGPLHPAPHHEHHTAEKEPPEKLMCELAYAGFLFWLPLVFCKEEKYRLTCANQGLWALITATVCCTLIRVAGTINGWFAGSIVGLVTGGVYALLFMLFLAVMLFLVWKCLNNAFAIHKGGELEPILFFDRFAFFGKGDTV